MEEYKGFRADRLKKAMKENGAAVEDIAKSLYEVFGLTEMDFACECAETLIYSNGHDISAGELYAACKAANVSADYLLGLSDEING